MTVTFTPAADGAPAGKLADAQIHFTEGILAGLKLVGFTVWEGRAGGDRSVTFPARQYVINGERRHYSLLRSDGVHAAADSLRFHILQAYAAHIADATEDAARNALTRERQAVNAERSQSNVAWSR